MSRVSETLARPARTGAQGGLAYAIVEVIDSFGANFTSRQYGALLLLLTIAVGAAQVFLENRTGKAVLRTIPAPRQAEVFSDAKDEPSANRPPEHPVQTDNRPKMGDPNDLDPMLATGGNDWTGEEMR